VIVGGALLVLALLVGSVWVVRSQGATSAQAAPSPTPTPTMIPSPPPGVWRIDGVVLDEQGKPVKDVCVGIGPGICTNVNPRTDADGYWSIELPKASVDYDFHFTKAGYKQLDMHIKPVTSQTFTLRLTR
jgi:hypothetical protein